MGATNRREEGPGARHEAVAGLFAGLSREWDLGVGELGGASARQPRRTPKLRGERSGSLQFRARLRYGDSVAARPASLDSLRFTLCCAW